MGYGYGPIVVARERLTLEQLREEEIVVPGRLTTAYLVLRMALGGRRPRARCRSTRSSTRWPRVRARAGLLIHEGQLTYGTTG